MGVSGPWISIGWPASFKLGNPAAFVSTPRIGLQVSDAVVQNLYPLAPLQRVGLGWLLNQAPPMLAKNTPRMPPMTPTGVSAASINGKRNSALANIAFCPENSR